MSQKKFIYFYPHSPEKSSRWEISTWIYRIGLWFVGGFLLTLITLIFFQMKLIYSTSMAEKKEKNQAILYNYYSQAVKSYSIHYSKKQEHLVKNLAHFLAEPVRNEQINLKKLKHRNRFNAYGVGGKGEKIRGSDLIERYSEKLIDDKLIAFNEKKDFSQIIDQDILLMEDSLKAVRNFNIEMSERKSLLSSLPILWPIKRSGEGQGQQYQDREVRRPGYWITDQNSSRFTIHLNEEATIVASAQGKIKEITPLPNQKYQVIIKHNFGFTTYYQGLNNIQVKENDLVDKGEEIGTSQEKIIYRIKIGRNFVPPGQFTLIKY